MFDNIGRNSDEEFTKRRAASVSLTLLMVGGGIGLWVGIGIYTAVEVILDPNLDEEMVELLTEEMVPDLPPPPPPPPAAQAEETEETEPTPDELVEDIKELDENVKDEIKSDIKPAGVEGGVEGGVVGGVVGGTLGPHGGVRVFHHSELEVKKREYPEYPEAARELNLGDQRCLAVVYMDEEGVPYQVNIDNCPKVFELPTKEAMLKWRWYPPKDGKSRVKAQTTIAVTYKMK